MKRLFLICLTLTVACQAQTQSTGKPENDVATYATNHPENNLPSTAHGTVGNGHLENGKLLPFNGPNFRYFDEISYCSGRAYTHEAVRTAVVGAYKRMETAVPGRMFCLMECSHEHGGRLFPHKTHQNGLSVDFMMPVIKDDAPYYALDSLGASHYWLEFNNEGCYVSDKAVAIDFDLVAQHLLALDAEARTQGFKIGKVIIKIELKDELFATTHGKKLKESGIYVVQSLTPIINSLHDEHYHVDFEAL